MQMMFSRRALVGGSLAAMVTGSARAMDAPASAIQNFCARLVAAMREAAGQSIQARYARLAPAMASAFDFGTMTRLAVGPAYGSASGGQQAAMRQAFEIFMGAYYANRIDGYSGEKFEVEPQAESRGGQKVVKTRLVKPGGGSTQIDYLMSGSRIIDIYLDGTISEVSSRRSEFASILASGGPDALVKALRDKSASLLGG